MRIAFNPAIASPEDLVAALLAIYHENGASFTSFDNEALTALSETILETNKINDRQINLLRTRLSGYRRYLSRLQIQKYKKPITVETVHVKKQTIQKMTCTKVDKDTLRLDFKYDENLVNKVKAIPKRMYHSKANEKYYTVPNTPKNIRTLLNMGFDMPKSLIVDTEAFDISFEGLKRQLRPYQEAGAARIAGELNLRALLADDMGLGKTAQTLAVLHARKKDALPAIIVCPATLKWNWAKEAHMWLDGIVVRVLGGHCQRTSYKVRPNEIAIINYDVLAPDKKGTCWAEVLSNADFKTVVLDECHKVKNKKTKRTEAVQKLVEGKNLIALSGTPIESRPEEFFPILSMLDPDLFPSWFNFMHRYCDGVHTDRGWDTKGASNVSELYAILTNAIMVRRLKKDVLKELPSKVRTVIPVDINMTEYNEAEHELQSYLSKERGEVIELKLDEDGNPLPQQGGGLAKVERLKQAAVLGKLDKAIQWIEDYLETGKKLVVFAHHVFVLDAIQKKFRNISVRVDGSVTGKKKELAQVRFQGDDSIRLFLGNIKAAGAGLTLTAASDTLTLELGWTPGEHEQAEDRTHRIGQEADSVTAYYLLAKGTIEEDIAILLDEKREVLSQILDGKAVKDTNMLAKLLAKYV